MTLGRESPVSRNGTHEAHVYMFPNGHSVVGEKDYLSPMSAVWKAWKLRCDLFCPNAENSLVDHSLQLPNACQIDSVFRSVLRNSQEPQDVRRHLKRVHFDGCIELAMQTEYGS